MAPVHQVRKEEREREREREREQTDPDEELEEGDVVVGYGERENKLHMKGLRWVKLLLSLNGAF
ncbi:hypothetical protein JCGZ_08625 [Jatropha curcas]|uniref:Uncharacterized protein n=1 Tax=Jatropha curcas TaxID=180498 RepID=A0A067KL55_JATCU|nr:hypothetical protein JCGZ_08625 [Jatropha curcas]